jgi:hypothetical protein
MSELSLDGPDMPVNYEYSAPAEPKFVTAKGTRPIDHNTGEFVRQPGEHRVVMNPNAQFVLNLATDSRAALAAKFAAKGRTGGKRR